MIFQRLKFQNSGILTFTLRSKIPIPRSSVCIYGCILVVIILAESYQDTKYNSVYY